MKGRRVTIAKLLNGLNDAGTAGMGLAKCRW